MKLLLGILATCALLLATACGSGSSKSSSPTQPAAPPTESPVKLDLSKDDLGRAVGATAAPYKRIVAMSPTVVELMYQVGATPIGRPNSADFPAQAKSLPDFGTAYNPNFEVIASMKPDLIIADAIIDQPVIDSLSKLGAPVFALKIASFDDVVRGLRVVGALSGNQSAGDAEAGKLTAKLTDIKSKLPATGPSVIVLVSAGPGQFIAEKDDSYLGDILKKMNAKNVVASTDPENFRFPGFSDYSKERILEKNPDVIIAVSIGGPPGTPSTADQVKSDSALSTLSAVKNNRVYEVDPFVYVQSAGPRLNLILDELPRLLYPTVFKS
ncbi:MAG TPA: ABC transporter substrate-binding protein [Dehalococcoidia bacterium]|jgi:iron complex transport system substrate-binding protein